MKRLSVCACPSLKNRLKKTLWRKVSAGFLSFDFKKKKTIKAWANK
jgi:hypothetical protein